MRVSVRSGCDRRRTADCGKSSIFEFRAGAFFGIDGPHGDKEGTPDVNLELLYGPIGGEYRKPFLNQLLRPRLHFGGTINTEGNTNELYAGFTWDVFLTRRLFVEGSFGGALHDGDDTYFGCRANFMNRAQSDSCCPSDGM